MSTDLEALADRLNARREAIVKDWMSALFEESPLAQQEALDGFCSERVNRVLDELRTGEAHAVAEAGVPAGISLPIAYRLLDRILVATLVGSGCADVGPLVMVLEDAGTRRLVPLLRSRDEGMARRLTEAEDAAASAAERVREVARMNAALRHSEAQSHHRAEQLGLLATVARRISAILEPELLLQEAADVIRARMNHTFVAIVVLDDEGVLVGRWAGRAGVGRRSAGRTQGPVGGIIGRALRKRAPQVVPDVSADPDYHPDVLGTRSEMVIPLLEGSEAIGAMDFQAERAAAFDLDAVAAGETLAEFLVGALRNARLFAESRRASHGTRG